MGVNPDPRHAKGDQREQRVAAALLALAAVVIILAGLGLRDPWPADEPRFAQVAKVARSGSL